MQPARCCLRPVAGSRAAHVRVLASKHAHQTGGHHQNHHGGAHKHSDHRHHGEDKAKSAKYSAEMQAKMGTSHHYNHEEGLNYNRILPDLIVGSCLQNPDDVDHLADHENVRVVFCLQEDKDMRYWNLDLHPIEQRCRERGDIKHVRVPVKDFNPQDLRVKLPRVVATLLEHHDPERGAVYIHCTAGMGRAPATAIAYMSWIRGIQLDQAYQHLTTIRRCGPKIEAIRSATADLLLGMGPVMSTIGVHKPGHHVHKMQVAGLDVGWSHRLDMHWVSENHRFELKRSMWPGTYQFKLIMDGKWGHSKDHPITKDAENNVNNTIEVMPVLDGERKAKFDRIMTPHTELTAEEKETLAVLLQSHHQRV